MLGQSFHFRQYFFDDIQGLFHLVRAKMSDTAHTETRGDGKFPRIKNVPLFLDKFIEHLEVERGFGGHFEGDDDGDIEGLLSS